MEINANDLPDHTSLKTRICIVGSGAAGFTIADQLLPHGVDVILLEAGGYKPEGKNQSLFEGELGGIWGEGSDYPYLTQSRLRQVGGTTNHWSGMCRPLDNFDFKKKPWNDLTGWPLTGEELQDYYKKAAQILEIPQFDDRPPFSEQGEDGFGFHFPKFDLDQNHWFRSKFFHYSPPVYFRNKYAEKIRNHPRIRLITHANCTEVIPHHTGKKVDFLKVKTLGPPQRNLKVFAEIFVLCAGGIENARILLNSNTHQRNGVGNENGLVGRFFMEHPHIFMGEALLWKAMSSTIAYQLNPGGIKRPLAIFCPTQKYIYERQSLNFSIELRPKPVVLEEMEALGKNFVKGVQPWARNLRDHLPLEKEYSDYFDSFRESTQAITYFRTEQSPNPLSRVLLIPEKDPLGMQRIKLDWQITSEDYECFYQMAEDFAGALTASFQGMGRIRMNRSKLQDFHIGTGHHHMGTTRMSETPQTGVVNQNCQVHGIENLYVGGSSVFSTSGFANPTMSIVALALRLSDYLIEKAQT